MFKAQINQLKPEDIIFNKIFYIKTLSGVVCYFKSSETETTTEWVALLKKYIVNISKLFIFFLNNIKKFLIEYLGRS